MVPKIWEEKIYLVKHPYIMLKKKDIYLWSEFWEYAMWMRWIILQNGSNIFETKKLSNISSWYTLDLKSDSWNLQKK